MIKNTTAQRVYPPNAPMIRPSFLLWHHDDTRLELVIATNRSCSSTCTCSHTAECWYEQEEQNEDDQEHNSPLRVSSERSHVNTPFVRSVRAATYCVGYAFPETMGWADGTDGALRDGMRLLER